MCELDFVQKQENMTTSTTPRDILTTRRMICHIWEIQCLLLICVCVRAKIAVKSTRMSLFKVFCTRLHLHFAPMPLSRHTPIFHEIVRRGRIVIINQFGVSLQVLCKTTAQSLEHKEIN